MGPCDQACRSVVCRHMGGLLRPVGPLPPSVYWTRRIIVLALLALVIWLIVSLLTPDKPAKNRADGSPWTPTAGRRAIPAAMGASTPGGSDSRLPDVSPDRPTSPPTPDPDRRTTACTSESLDTAIYAAEKGDVSAGSPVPVVVEFSNPDADPCVLTVDATKFRVRITSGSDLIWDTADCPSLVRKTRSTLKDDHSATVTVTWPGTRSDEGCSTEDAPVLPGWYRAEILLNGKPSASTQFRLA